jgi:hypothetical protein
MTQPDEKNKGGRPEQDIFDGDETWDIDGTDFGGDLLFDDVDFTGLDFNLDTGKKRYILPCKQTVTKTIKYRNAVSIARDIGNINEGDRYFILLDGNFIFGDLIEAWVIENQYNILEMTVSTLSLSENNIDSLGNLFYGDYLQKLNIIVSTYFYSHERSNLIPYLYRELDKNNALQFAVARVHTKIYLLKTECGKKIVMHGSANLRTSGNVEQIIIECSNDLYDFNYSFLSEIIEKYKTINKAVEGGELWQVDQTEAAEAVRLEARQALPKREGRQPSQG